MNNIGNIILYLEGQKEELKNISKEYSNSIENKKVKLEKLKIELQELKEKGNASIFEVYSNVSQRITYVSSEQKNLEKEIQLEEKKYIEVVEQICEVETYCYDMQNIINLYTTYNQLKIEQKRNVEILDNIKTHVSQCLGYNKYDRSRIKSKLNQILAEINKVL